MRNHICRGLLVLLTLLFLCEAFAADTSIQKILVEPLSGGVSFNTITFAVRSLSGWVTAPTVEMRGRKRVVIQNNSTTDSIYLTGVSGSSAKGTLGSGKVASFGASSDLHIYVSANTATTVDVWEIR